MNVVVVPVAPRVAAAAARPLAAPRDPVTFFHPAKEH